MADPILESSLKTGLNAIDCDIFDKFQVCIKTAASLFPFSCEKFLISKICKTYPGAFVIKLFAAVINLIVQ